MCDFDQKVVHVFPLNTVVDFLSVFIEELFRLCLAWFQALLEMQWVGFGTNS